MILLRGMSIHSRWEPGLLFVGLLIFYVACPVNTPFDSAWYLPTALSILKEGKVNIDEYAPTFPQGHGTIEVKGHWYNDYPLGPALVALPFVAAITFPQRAKLTSNFGICPNGSSPPSSFQLQQW